MDLVGEVAPVFPLEDLGYLLIIPSEKREKKTPEMKE